MITSGTSPSGSACAIIVSKLMVQSHTDNVGILKCSLCKLMGLAGTIGAIQLFVNITLKIKVLKKKSSGQLRWGMES